MKQSTNTVFLVSPATFGFNPETAGSNEYQHDYSYEDATVQQKAQKEWDGVCAMLVKERINVIAIMDTLRPPKPDALFPNNWITTHDDGRIILYPLLAHNRRPEKRLDIVHEMTKKFLVTDIIDLSFYEKENQFLEGTGSMILDRMNKIIYTCLSPRTHLAPLEHVAKLLGYQVVSFHAYNHERLIYHTNIYMALGTGWVALCMDAIPDVAEKEKLTHYFSKTGKELIQFSKKQIDAFAGNILELETIEGTKKIVMSKTAYESLDDTQKQQFTKYGEIIYSDVSTIETIGGGGIRCLLAELFLKPL